MSKVSDKGYVQLFYILMKFKKDMDISKPTAQDIDFATNLTFLINYFSDDLFQANYEYNGEEKKLVSSQLANYFNFINIDFDGIIYELANKSESHYDELVAVNYFSDVLKSFDISNADELHNVAVALYFNKKFNVNKFGDCKKALTKDKIHNDVDLEVLKETYKKLQKDLKNTKFLK